MPGVVTPRTIAMARDILAGADGARSIARHGSSRFRCCCVLPAITPDATSSSWSRPISCPQRRPAFPASDLLVIEYLDSRGKDGNARKYRVMMIGGQIYPLHLAISGNWKVHYFTSDMADKPDHRREEAAFSATCGQPRGQGVCGADGYATRSASTMPVSISGLARRRSVAVRSQCHDGDRLAGPRRALGLSAHRHQHHP